MAQIGNLLYRRIAFGGGRGNPTRAGTGHGLQIGNLRCGRLKICATGRGLGLGLLAAALVLAGAPVWAATNDLTAPLQRGLFEEEANQNLGAAIQAYQSVANQFDKDRKLAATAIFRLGECYRKQGHTNEAAVEYERILREFADQPTLVALSRQNLAALGSPAPAAAAPVLSDAARQEQKRLLEEEIKLVQNQLDVQKKKIEVGRADSSSLWPIEREILELRRKVAAVEAGLPVSFAASETGATAATTEADEVRRIQALIKDSPDLINAPDRNGETLLESAAAKGKLAVVKLLLDSGAAVDGLQQPGLTALDYAAANGHKAVVDLLLSKGAKAGAQTESGITPLHLAAAKGYEEVAKALLAAGAPVNAQTKGAGQRSTENLQYHAGAGTTPLQLAALGGYTGMVELLLSKGADANMVDGSGRTALSYAAENHYDGVLQSLLAAHANPDAGQRGLPLLLAAYQGDVASLKLLLGSGANPNTNGSLLFAISVAGASRTSGPFTPLFLAIYAQHPEAVAELLRFKADPNLPCPYGVPLSFALSDPPILRMLLDNGADPNMPASDGVPMLLRAVWAKNPAAVELLLAHKADVNATDASPYSDRGTALEAAAAIGNTNIAELLLKAGADVNAKDKAGNTPLWQAVLNRHPDMAEVLLAHKADPNVRNNAGATPLDLAKRMAQQGSPAVSMGFVQGRGQSASLAVAAQQEESKPEAMADLLRRYGALDDLPYLDQIGVRRGATGAASALFAKGASDWNHFTLLDLLGVEYRLPGPYA